MKFYNRLNNIKMKENRFKDYYNKLISNMPYPDQFVVMDKQHFYATEVFDSQVNKSFRALNLCSNDLFCFTENTRVKTAAMEAIDRLGASNSGAHALNGRSIYHQELERDIAQLKGMPYSHLFLNAWMAVAGFVNSYCHFGPPLPGFDLSKPVHIFADTLSHACQMSAANNATKPLGRKAADSPNVHFHLYKHLSAKDLKKRIERYCSVDDRILVLTDSVFSMDADIAPLPEIAAVLSNYNNATLFLDEAHATGMLGTTGKGLLEHYNMQPSDFQSLGIDLIIMTTFSKFAGSAGAAISSFNKEVIDILNFTPTSIGTISLSPPLCAATSESIKLLLGDNELPKRLRRNTQLIRDQLAIEGFEVLGSTPVIPIILPNDIHPQEFARKLLHEHGVWVSAVWYVSKPKIRIVANSELTVKQIDEFIKAMVSVRESFCMPIQKTCIK